MEIDNDKRASRAKMILISIPFVLLLVNGLLAIFLVILTWIPTIVSGLLVLLGWSITVILRLKSVKFRFNEENVSVLYYPITPMTSNFNKIEISANRLVRFEIKKSMMGLNRELVLYENISGQEASYPPVSITLFGKDTLRILEEYLTAYCPAGTSS
ncbi:MAG: hypothetical protein WC699_09660 [Bacteroidales bacterium]